MELAGLVIPFLICSAFSLTLPGVGNYMLTHNSSENREALESAKKNITEGSVRVFSDEAKSIPVSSKTDDESPMEHINLEASEVSNIKDIESSERNVSGDKKSADGDRLEPDSHLRAKVPLDVFEETPVLPKLSLFEPDALWTSESKPKPLKVAVNSGVKTVYVQATKTVKQKPMCITVYGLKPACDDHSSNGFKHLGLEGASENRQPKRDGGITRRNKPTEQESSVEKRSLSSPLLTHPRVSQNTGETSLDELSEGTNDNGHSNAALHGHTEPEGKHLVALKRFVNIDDNKISPYKAKPHAEVVTETIYSTQVLQEDGPTATLVVENCVPSNFHIPFCGNIYPNKVPEVAPNYFTLPIPVMQATFPVDHHITNMPLTTSNLFVPNKGSHKPGLSGLTNHKAPPHKFPPTSFLQKYIPGFMNRLFNFRHSLSTAHAGLHKVGHPAILAANVAANLANNVHSHLHHHKVKVLGSKLSNRNGYSESTGEKLPTSFDGNIKPVKEEQQDDTTPELRLEDILATTKSSDLKTLDSLDGRSGENYNSLSTTIQYSTDDDSLKQAIVKIN